MPARMLPPRSPRGWLSVAAGTTIIGLLALALVGSGKTPPPPFPTPIPTVILTPSCVGDPTDLSVIQRQLDHGDFATAFTLGQTALTSGATAPSPGQPLCPDARTALANLTINAGLKVITTTRVDNPGDATVQNAQVEQYRDLLALAKSYAVPLPETALSISHDAYASSSFLLAIRAYEDALANGETTPTDMVSLRQYVSATRNLGEWERTAGTAPATRQDGPRWLRTSALVDVQYGVGDGVAAGTLRSLYGTDESRWPEPMPSTLLK